MKSWQKYWLYLVIAFFILHTVRDIFQDLGIQNFLSTVYVKHTGYRLPMPWRSLNTYIVEFIQTTLAVNALRTNRFAWTGALTIIIATIFFISWLYYWFFL